MPQINQEEDPANQIFSHDEGYTLDGSAQPSDLIPNLRDRSQDVSLEPKKIVHINMSNNVDDINWEAFKLLPSLLNVLNDIRMTQTEEGRSPMAKNMSMFVNQIEECRKIIDTLPGANYSEEEKTKMFRESKAKLEEKCEMVKKYQRFEIFSDEVHKTNESNDMQVEDK